MEAVESYIEDRPDSALAVLRGIGSGNLKGRAEKAKYSLMMTMALDKNYVDTCDFSVLQPAIDWYRNHGTKKDRFLARYYEGVIFINPMDTEAAMECFVEAEKYAHAGTYRQQGLLYRMESAVYQRIFELDKAEKAAGKAADIYMENRDTSKYVDALCDLAPGRLWLGRAGKGAGIYGRHRLSGGETFVQSEKHVVFSDAVTFSR